MQRVRLALRSGGFGQIGTGFADILDFIPLPTLEFAVHKGGSERAITEVFCLTNGCVDRMLGQRMLDGGTVAQRVKQVVLRFLEQGFHVACLGGEEPGEPTLLARSAFQVPVGLAFLIQRSLWRSLALLPSSKWDSDCDVQNLLREVRNAANACDLKGEAIPTFVPATELQPANSFFSTLADDLCEWSRAILNTAADPDVTASGLEQYVIWLNSMREATCKSRNVAHVWEHVVSRSGKRVMGGDFSKLAESHGRYRALFLIQCVLLAFEVKSSSSLAIVMQRAFAVLPEFWSTTLAQCFNLEYMPSGATISRSRLYLDASFMLYMRERHEELICASSVFFVLMDSSPQGFQNWMMSEACSCPTVLLSV